MEGNAKIEAQDTANVSPRFKMMAALDMTSKGRVKGNWYTAVPPLCRDNTGLTPVDYFGRELVDKLPEKITVGVINVAVAGCSIDMFDEDKSQSYLSTAEDWLKGIAALYDNHPYKVLVELGKKAQEDGVIKGILLHQGESNTGDANWPKNVKKIYDNLISDLSLDASKVPLLVGEVVNSDSGGVCGGHNAVIAKVPDIIPNSYVISSSGLASGGDGLHFSASSYREFGKRYAETMLSILEKQGEDDDGKSDTIKDGPNPNFHIYLAFGQSNMDGAGEIEDQDLTVSERFKMMPAIDFPSKKREKWKWYTAVPPLCRETSGLSPCDYFGRELVDKLPEEISVGIINVAVPGCSIDLFDPDLCANYLKTAADWLQNFAKLYDNDPYKTLIDAAKVAQKDGVIKGFLIHQGETNTGDPKWPENVKRIYDRMLSDLGLKYDDVALLVGEVVNADSGGSCAAHNNVIAKVPDVIPNSYVIKSNGLPNKGDGLHFTSASYRIFGKRYAEAMLEFLGKQGN
jgi:lysophospholipase L1-like esterase